ncbi:MAG: NAD(P)H-dependent oxidoreductase [Spirochaetales bacterium]|nr:NAD(P)H-dependent oxidoreductase [Spirochaetales bacterium]
MKLVVLNGSPRGTGSNTKILMDAFLEGFTMAAGAVAEAQQLFLYRDSDDLLIKSFTENDTIILAFPLYTDSVPGKVKYFLEQMKDLDWLGKRIGIVVQSGFPEARHTSFIARYLERLIQRMGAEHIGSVTKGGVEGIQIQPEKWKARLKDCFHRLGEGVYRTGTFDPDILAALRKPWELSPALRRMYRLMSRVGLADFYWNYNLKKNGTFEQRFDKPYEREHHSLKSSS